jgi:hypothetical protein
MAVGFEKQMLQKATAVREVTDFEEMGTMWAEPEGVKWVSFGASGVLVGGAVDVDEEDLVE